MSLTIMPVKEDKMPKPENGYCKGFKVIKCNNSSLYFNHQFTLGENVSSRKCKCGAKKCSHCRDIDSGLVSSGFHLFIDLDKAINYHKWCYRPPEKEYFHGYKIIEVYFKPEDVVRYGLSGSDLAVVVMKLEVRSLEEVCNTYSVKQISNHVNSEKYKKIKEFQEKINVAIIDYMDTVKTEKE